MTTKILTLSDIHLEFYMEKYAEQACLHNIFDEVIDRIDAVIIAGDLSLSYCIEKHLDDLCEVVKKDIYFVLGNHDFWSRSFNDVFKRVKKSCKKHSNLKWLNNSEFKINDTKIIGTTLWFSYDLSGVAFEEEMGDFLYIDDFKDFVYDENEKALNYLKNNVDEKSVVVTHQMPSKRSISPQYLKSQINRFFVCPEAEEIIINNNPKIWIHGHTHSSCDYHIGKTRVLCNPVGYPHVLNWMFKKKLIIEV